jgi:hypothetical protein
MSSRKALHEVDYVLHRRFSSLDCCTEKMVPTVIAPAANDGLARLMAGVDDIEDAENP